MKQIYFYRGQRMVTVAVDGVCWSIFQAGEQLMAEWRQAGKVMLLATDRQRTVSYTHETEGNAFKKMSYTPYGVSPRTNIEEGLLGYAGERRDGLLDGYWLGKGYRRYSTLLGRFNSPDSWSPFGRGGINAYAYCAGDPVNFTDPSGHMVPKRSGTTGQTPSRLTASPRQTAARDNVAANKGAAVATSGAQSTFARRSSNDFQVEASPLSSAEEGKMYRQMSALDPKQMDNYLEQNRHLSGLVEDRSSVLARDHLLEILDPENSPYYRPPVPRGILSKHLDLVNELMNPEYEGAIYKQVEVVYPEQQNLRINVFHAGVMSMVRKG